MMLGTPMSNKPVHILSAVILLLTLHEIQGATVRIHLGALVANASEGEVRAPTPMVASAPGPAPSPGQAPAALKTSEPVATNASISRSSSTPGVTPALTKSVAELPEHGYWGRSVKHIDGETYASDWLHEHGTWTSTTEKPSAKEMQKLQEMQDQRWKEFLEKRKALEEKLTAARKQAAGGAVKVPKVPEQGFEGKTVQHIDGSTGTDDWQHEYGAHATTTSTTTATKAWPNDTIGKVVNVEKQGTNAAEAAAKKQTETIVNTAPLTKNEEEIKPMYHFTS